MRTLSKPLPLNATMHTVRVRNAQGNWITLITTNDKDNAMRVYDMVESQSDNPVSLGEYDMNADITRIIKGRD